MILLATGKFPRGFSTLQHANSRTNFADLNLHETVALASLQLQINTRLFVFAIIKAFRLLAGSAARACAVSTKLLSRRCALVFRSLQIQSLQPPVQLAGTWSLI